jgi:tetratricopeptide (TPR) repeat protein
MSKLAHSMTIKGETALFRCALFVVLVLSSLAGRAQYGSMATLDTLDVRHDRSKPAAVRMEATKNHAVACLYAGRAEEVRSTALFALDLVPELKHDTLLTLAYIVTSLSCKESDPGKALEYLYKALDHAERSGDANLMGWVEKETGIVFKQMGQYREAIRWLKISESHVTNTVERNRTACHLSEAYAAVGLLDSALHQAQASNITDRVADDPYGYARSQHVIGKAYAAKGEADMAALFFQKAIAVCDSFNIARVMPYALVGLGHVRLATRDAQGAIDLGRRAMGEAERTNNLPAALETTDLLEQAYHAAGKADSAYASLKLHSTLQDSLLSVQALSKVEGMRFGQQLKDKEEEQARIEAQQERSRNIQFGIIALIVITLGIFLLIFSRTAVVGAKAIKNLSLIALLLFFEFINLLMHPFLGELTHHSPILMLLCMAAIAGLLIPLHHRMEKLITNMLVSKNNRVRLEAARRTIEELESKSDKAQ